MLGGRMLLRMSIIFLMVLMVSYVVPASGQDVSSIDVLNPGSNNLDNFGYSVVDGADLNADGVTDFIICGYYEGNAGQNKQGFCQAYSGDNLTALFDFGNPVPQTYSVSAVFTDLDGNGLNDVITGSNLKANGKDPLSGQVIVSFIGSDRKGNLGIIETQAIDNPEPAPGAQFGHSVALLEGTVPMVAVGAPGLGKVFLYSIENGGLVYHSEIPETSETPVETFGYSMAVVDNHLLIGAPGVSSVFIFESLGDGTFFTPFAISGPSGFGKFTAALGNVDVINGGDFAVGTHDGQGNGVGNISVYDIQDLATPFLSFAGNRAASVGTWDCDEKLDIAVGSAYFDAGSYYHNPVYILSGEDASSLYTIENSDWQLFDGFGYSFAVGGDMNSDEEPEIVVGAPGTADRRGQAYAFMGRPVQYDSDGDGIADKCDNCPGILNPNGWDRDGDGWGDACDNCVKVPNGPNEVSVPNVGDQADFDEDGVGDACETLSENLAAGYGSTCEQNQSCPMEATFKNDTGSSIVTIHPDCFNTIFTLTNVHGEIQPPTNRIRTAYGIGDYSNPLDVDAIGAGGDSRTTLCDLSQLYPPEVLFCNLDEMGGNKTFYVQATYVNHIRDPFTHPLTGQCEPGVDCFDIFLGSVSSNVVPVVIYCPIEIVVDIKPGDGSVPTINIGLNGNIPVAVLSTPEFDASTIDPWTTELAGATNKLKSNGLLQYSIADKNGDGLPDLMLHFEIEGFAPAPEGEITILTGTTFDGKYVEGKDLVRILDK